ncbi:hypothetical protein LTR17_026011 [Elasticomyces elasticus]|nr:hypothetical protein LTR17_026011 [Elasticomyces elasticus]
MSVSSPVVQSQPLTPFGRFRQIRDQLIEEISTLAGRQDAGQQGWVDAPRIVFEEHKHLLKEFYSTTGGDQRLCENFRKVIVGDSIEKSRARIFATLLSTGINPYKDSWTKFCRALHLEDERQISVELFDHALPLPRLEIARLLGTQVATDFCVQQWKYCIFDTLEVQTESRDKMVDTRASVKVRKSRLASSRRQPTIHEHLNTLAFPPRSRVRSRMSRSAETQHREFIVPPSPPDLASDLPTSGLPRHGTKNFAFLSEGGGLSEKTAEIPEEVAALRLAVDKRDDLKAYDILVSGIDPSLIRISYMPALHCMAATMQPDTTRALLDLGVAIDEPDGEGRTALVYALERNRYDAACMLIKRGARLDLPDSHGSTALHYAVSAVIRSHHTDEVFVRLLAAPNALVNTQNQAGDTPLHICAQSCTPDAFHYAKLMLDHDSNALDLKNQNGFSPLHFVADQKPRPDTDRMLKLLLQSRTTLTASSRSREGIDTSQATSLVLGRVNLDKLVQPISSREAKWSLRAASWLPITGVESDISMRSVAAVSGDWAQPVVNVLLSNENFTLLSNASMQDRGTGQAEYHTILMRLLTLFGANLKQEARDSELEVAANTLQKCASKIADRIIKKTRVAERSKRLERRLEKSLKDRLSDPHDDFDAGLSSSSSSDGNFSASSNLSTTGALKADDLTTLKDRILGSVAYRTFLESLSGHFRSKYVKNLHKSIGVARDDTALALQELRGLVYERIWLSRHEVRFSSAETLTLDDRMKGHVEDFLGERWNWWPLRPRSLPLKDGYIRVHWRCNCGEQRSADLQASIASELQAALRPTPSWVRLLSSNMPATAPGTLPHTSASGTAPSSQHAAGSTPIPSTPPLGAGGHSTGTTPSTTTSVSTQGAPTQLRSQDEHVFLGARRGLDLRIADLQVQSMNDEEFFKRLKHDYRQLRGCLRLWLSWWRFDHSEFYRFEKFAEDEFVPRIVDFPHIDNLDYKYMPRPIDPRPPISKHEFRKRYYNSCNQPSSWHRPWHNCKKFCSRRSQALEVIPKRSRILETGGHAREDFWGILAQERRYFAWVLGYFLLTLVPSIVFFFMWLFRWSHANDLQNASVPITVTLTLWAVFAAVLWQDRAVVWED